MPYLSYVFCEKCNNVNLDIDEAATIDCYRTEGRKTIFVNPATLIWDYLIYTCPYCRTQYKYTFKDIERKTRMYFSEKAEKYKNYFDIELKWGVQNDVENRVNTEQYKMDRFTLRISD